MRHKKTGGLRLVRRTSKPSTAATERSQKTTPGRSRRLPPDERRRRKIVRTERRVRAKLKADLRNTVPATQVGLQKEDGLADHTWQALKTIGVFYRTAQGATLFFRHPVARRRSLWRSVTRSEAL